MTNSQQFTHIFDRLLREHVYGEITVQRFVTTYCEETCRDWQPLSDRVYNSFHGESQSHYDLRVLSLLELEEESRVCQGHLEPVETVKGMLRSYTFTPPAEDHSVYGTLSMTVLPWDATAKRLTRSRVIRSRVFDYRHFDGGHGFSVVTDYVSSALVVDMKRWIAE